MIFRNLAPFFLFCLALLAGNFHASAQPVDQPNSEIQTLLKGLQPAIREKAGLPEAIAQTRKDCASQTVCDRSVLLLLRNLPVSDASLELREPLSTFLESKDRETRIATCSVIKAWKVPWFDPRLLEIGAHCCTETVVRIAALDAVVDRATEIDPMSFLVLKSQIYEQVPIAWRVRGADILARAPLSSDQLEKLAQEIASQGPLKAGPMVWRSLLPAFVRSNEKRVGLALLSAMKASPGVEAVPLEVFGVVMSFYPPDIANQADALLADALQQNEDALEKFPAIVGLMKSGKGSVRNGEELFLSGRVGCCYCHRVGEKGAESGSDLAGIGDSRGLEEILTAILKPSGEALDKMPLGFGRLLTEQEQIDLLAFLMRPEEKMK